MNAGNGASSNVLCIIDLLVLALSYRTSSSVPSNG